VEGRLTSTLGCRRGIPTRGSPSTAATVVEPSALLRYDTKAWRDRIQTRHRPTTFASRA
jgi:hypothetical protein